MRIGNFASGLAVAIIATTLPAHSVAPNDHWPFNGLFHVITATLQCGGNLQADEIYTAVYRPVIAGDTQPGALHLYKLRHALRMVDTSIQGQFRGSGNYNGTQFTGRGTIESFGGTYSGVVVSPATITATTKFVTMAGTVTNLDNRTGCIVTFRASFDLRAK